MCRNVRHIVVTNFSLSQPHLTVTVAFSATGNASICERVGYTTDSIWDKLALAAATQLWKELQ